MRGRGDRLAGAALAAGVVAGELEHKIFGKPPQITTNSLIERFGRYAVQLRQIGIEQAIRDAGLPIERTGFIVWTESLAGREIERRVPGRMAPANRTAAAVLNCLCAQDDLEPVLRR